MRRLKIAALSLFLFSPVVAFSQSTVAEPHMVITRNGTQPSVAGGNKTFTGTVRLDNMFVSTSPSTFSGAFVTFEPCARSDWHTHPAGQLLIVTSGAGWVQEWGQPKKNIKNGDIIWTPAGVKHWHGATDKTAMTHISINEAVNGKAVDWLEKVTDEQYLQ
ncbi:(R)-mandelonitrile lyase [Bartonella sp. LJL80]